VVTTTLNQNQRQAGMTLIDVLIVIATVAIAAGLLLPFLARSRSRSAHIGCVNNLKQVGLGFRMWSQDHGDQFPWNVAITNGGTLEPVTNGNALPHFLIATNELNSPKILACPNDPGRSRAAAWESLSLNNISYLIGLEASGANVASILSGDRTLSTNGVTRSGLLMVQNATKVEWAPGIHGAAGNIGMGDGSVQQMSQSQVANHFATKMTLPARFILP
jgi:competence protein ComGC